MIDQQLNWKASIEFDEGACFVVDFLNRKLCDFDIPDNTIKLADLEDFGTHYEFYYDLDRRNIGHSIHADGSDSKRIYKVCIRQLTGLHPSAMAAIYGVDVKDLQDKSDKQFFNELPQIRKSQWDQVKARDEIIAIEQRIAGTLPQIIIGKERFFFDGEQNLLQRADKPHVRIELSRMAKSGSDGFACFVDPWDCSPIYENVAAYGLHMLAHLALPAPEVLDPVGIARRRGFADTDLLYAYPFKKYQEVHLTPLSERAAEVIENKSVIHQAEGLKKVTKKTTRQSL